MDIFWSEFVGTMLLVLLGNGAVANVLLKQSKGENSGWIIISAGYGFAVAVGVYVVGWASGGHINPAVTLGFCIAGKTSWALMPCYFAGQYAGAFIGAILVWLSYYAHWEKTADKTKKLLCFATKPAIYKPWANLLTEIIATAVLLIGVLGIFDYHAEVAKGLMPYLIGILIFSIGLSLGGATGYAINPARDLSPRVVHAIFPIQGKGDSDWIYAWVPTFGPLIGSALGVAVYQGAVAWALPIMT